MTVAAILSKRPIVPGCMHMAAQGRHCLVIGMGKGLGGRHAIAPRVGAWAVGLGLDES